MMKEKSVNKGGMNRDREREIKGLGTFLVHDEGKRAEKSA